MPEQPLFSPAMVLGVPSKNQKGSNYKEATKTNSGVDPALQLKETKLEKEKSKHRDIPIVEITTTPSISETKKPGPAKTSENRIRTSYHISKNNVRYIDIVSGELKYCDVQNSFQYVVADEFLKIGQYFYEKYKHKLTDFITSGDQISEFILREYRKEFNIIDE